MIRLFKSDESGKPVAYHEAWVEPQHRRIVEHWGYVGDAGETATHRVHILGSLEKQFTGVLEGARALGFEELSESAYATLIIEYEATGEGSVTDRDKQEDIEDALNEKLGWLGLGFCDEGRIGDNRIEICCRVLDPDLATTVIAESLDASVFCDYSRIYQE
ncbi:MAG: hypothetical protein AAGA72_14565 [Pseudomonadota bacterium]